MHLYDTNRAIYIIIIFKITCKNQTSQFTIVILLLLLCIGWTEYWARPHYRDVDWADARFMGRTRRLRVLDRWSRGHNFFPYCIIIYRYMKWVVTARGFRFDGAGHEKKTRNSRAYTYIHNITYLPTAVLQQIMSDKTLFLLSYYFRKESAVFHGYISRILLYYVRKIILYYNAGLSSWPICGHFFLSKNAIYCPVGVCTQLRHETDVL